MYFATMDPTQQQSSPSEKLSAMNLNSTNSTPTKRTLHDFTVDTSSPASVFDNTTSNGSHSITGSPSLAESPSPHASPSPLERRVTQFRRYSSMRKPSYTKSVGGFSKPLLLKWSPSLPYELWDMVKNLSIKLYVT